MSLAPVTKIVYFTFFYKIVSGLSDKKFSAVFFVVSGVEIFFVSFAIGCVKFVEF